MECIDLSVIRTRPPENLDVPLRGQEPLAFHYTSKVAFKGILSGNLWFTSLANVNDKAEVKRRYYVVFRCGAPHEQDKFPQSAGDEATSGWSDKVETKRSFCLLSDHGLGLSADVETLYENEVWREYRIRLRNAHPFNFSS